MSFCGIVSPVVLLQCLCSDNHFPVTSVPGAAPPCAFPESLCPWSSPWLCWACTGHSLSPWMNNSTSQLLWWGWVVLWSFQVRQQYNSLFSLAACLHERRGSECFGSPVLPCSSRQWMGTMVRELLVEAGIESPAWAEGNYYCILGWTECMGCLNAPLNHSLVTPTAFSF